MKKAFLVLALSLTVILSAVSCSGNNALQIWVGSESQEFYAAKMVEYVTEYNATHEDEFPYEIEVLAVDTGTAAATFLDDPEAGADIFTVAHDNLGKLTAGSSSIAPVTSPELLAQIQADNPQSFLDVIDATVNGTTYTFGVPYIAQALVLYYNTDYVTAEQAQTWEGVLEAAKIADKQALSLTGTDGYNNSFLLLATDASDHSTSLKLYEGGVQEECFGSGDDTIAIMKWGQRFFGDPNGAKAPSESGWVVELSDTDDSDPVSISVIGGAWHFNAAQAALGDKLGITTLPTFTITEEDAYGTVEAGTVFKSGTFADAKIFVMKKASEKQEYLEDILLYLSSKEMQEASFETAQNLPAYKNASTEFDAFQEDTLEADLASSQVEMFEWGLPQPFGYSNKFNFYFYSKGAPDLILAILENENGDYDTDAAILAEMLNVENIWKTGLQLDE